jgi:hypothetical protein
MVKEALVDPSAPSSLNLAQAIVHSRAFSRSYSLYSIETSLLSGDQHGILKLKLRRFAISSP